LAFELLCFEALDGESTQLKLCAPNEYDLQRWFRAFKQSGMTLPTERRLVATQKQVQFPQVCIESDHTLSQRKFSNVFSLTKRASCTISSDEIDDNATTYMRRPSLTVKSSEQQPLSCRSHSTTEDINEGVSTISVRENSTSPFWLIPLKNSDHWPIVEAKLWLDDHNSIWAPVLLQSIAATQATVEIVGHPEAIMIVQSNELRSLEIPADPIPADDRIELTLEPGAPCRAVYLGDRQWYEAVVLENFDQYVIVLFIEYDETQNTAIQLLSASALATPFIDNDNVIIENDFDDEFESSMSHDQAREALEAASPAMLNQEEKALDFYASLVESGVPLDAVRLAVGSERSAEFDILLTQRRRARQVDDATAITTQELNPLSQQLLTDLQHSFVFGDVFLHQLFTRQIDRRGDGRIKPLDFVLAIKNNDPTNKLAAAAISTFATFDENQKGELSFDDFKRGIRKYGRAKNGYEDVKSLLFFWRTTSEEWFESSPSV